MGTTIPAVRGGRWVLGESAPGLARLSVMVVAGSLVATTVWAQPAVQLSAFAGGTGNGFVINGNNGNDQLGRSVAGAGDVNGDGIDDLIVAAPYTNYGFGSNYGSAFVVFGKSTPTPIDISLVENGTGGFEIGGMPLYLGFGSGCVSSAGDVNGDGLSDVIVGGAYSSGAGGKSFVVFGKTDTTFVNTTNIEAGIGGFAIYAELGFGELAGFAVSGGGDINNDSFDDLIVGAFRADPTGYAAGAVYVVHGKTSGGAVQLSQVAVGSGGFRISGEAPSDYAGRAACGAGDVNGDGLADIVLGAHAADAVFPNGGRAYVVFGRTASTEVFLSDVGTGTSALGFAIDPDSLFDSQAARSVASAGDVNGDGLADVIVGCPFFNTSAGDAHIIFGKSTGSNVLLSSIRAGVGGGFTLNGGSPFIELGYGVSAAGDMNGDGLGDVIVGARYAATPAGGGGRAFVVLGKTGFATVQASDVAAGTGGFAIDGFEATSAAGLSVANAGDVNNDGLSDVIVGAHRSDPAAQPDAGCAYVVFSGYTPPALATYYANLKQGFVDPSAIGTSRYGNDESQFGDARLALDFDGGFGPGLGNSSPIGVTIARADPMATGFSATDTANVYWVLGGTRFMWFVSGITVTYTDAEIAGLTEANLKLYKAPSPTGPWTQAAFFNFVDTDLNQCYGELSSIDDTFPQYFIIADEAPVVDPPPTATITRLMLNPTANQAPAWSVSWSESVAPTFGIGDITPTGSLAGSVSFWNISGGDPNYIVQLVSGTETANGSLGFDIPAGSVSDTAANPTVVTFSAPPYTVNEVAAGFIGDVNKDGFVNVADVTHLANFITSGSPPLP